MDDGHGLLAAHPGVSDLAHPGIEPELIGGLDGVVILHKQPGRSRTIAEVEFRAEIPPRRHKLVENDPVPPDPGREAGAEHDDPERRANQAAFPAWSGQEPQSACRQKDQQRWIAQAGQSPKHSQQYPSAVGGLIAQAQGHHQGPGKKTGRERRIPDPANRILHGCRIKHPYPGRPAGDVLVEAARPDLPYRACGQRRKQAVDGQDGPGRKGGEDAKTFEYASQDQGKQRPHPGGRTGVTAKGIGEAVACGQRPGNPAHLFAEEHVVVVGVNAVGMGERQVENPHGEGGREHVPRRSQVRRARLGRFSCRHLPMQLY